MARPLRIIFNGAWYHVMNRGATHKNIFFDKEDRLSFLMLLNKLTEVYGIEVHVYCLMSNHYHLVMHTPRGNLSAAMRYLNSSYTQYINRKWKKDGALFKGRYKAILISADDYLLAVSRYIHRNPMDAKMVNNLCRYEWSSYKYYLEKETPPSWLIMREIKIRFGVNKFEDRYKNYVEKSCDKKLEEFYNSIKFQPVLAGDDFCNLIDEYVKKHSLSAEIVGADYIRIPPSIHTILNVVSFRYNISYESLIQSMSQKTSQARKVAMYLCRNVAGCQVNEIAATMNGMTYAGVSKSISRTENDPKLMREIAAIKVILMNKSKILSES